MRRDRGVSLLELIFAIAIIVTTVLLVGQTASSALAWHETQARVVAAATSAERLRALLAVAVCAGRPIDALSVTEKGELVEAPVAGARPAWRSGPALVLRGAGAYWIIERAGSRLVRRRLGFDGRAEAVTLETGVLGASFELVRAPREPSRLLGVGYRVSFAGRAEPVRGFTALRVEVVSAPPPPAPRAAVRWPHGGDR